MFLIVPEKGFGKRDWQILQDQRNNDQNGNSFSKFVISTVYISFMNIFKKILLNISVLFISWVKGYALLLF